MGGIYVDSAHRTSMKGLYAAGECACQYHGANRLGGNSMLGAVYGGEIAAKTVIAEYDESGSEYTEVPINDTVSESSPVLAERIGNILVSALGIVRNENGLKKALEELSDTEREYSRLNDTDRARIQLARAMLLSALERRESRGAHFREDYPEPNEAYRKILRAGFVNGSVSLRFEDIPDRRVPHGDKDRHFTQK